MAADLSEFNLKVVQPALDRLYRLGGPPPTAKATRMLLAIALQEGGPSLLRRQTNGPARGCWQFERGGGVQGVMYHQVTTNLARKLVRSCGVAWDDRAIHPALEHNDLLACGFARLLLLTDPQPLPLSFEKDKAWDYYRRNWRPGRARPDHWANCWTCAEKAVGMPA